MEANETCFSRVLLPGCDWKDELEACRATLAQRSTADIWTLLDNDVEGFRDRLSEWMEAYAQDVDRALLAALTYCDLVNVPGSEAYRACNRKSLKTFLIFMRKHFNGVTDDNENGKKKKRKHDLTEENQSNWDFFFRTLKQASDELEIEEIAQTLVGIGMLVVSSEAIETLNAMGSSTKKRLTILKVLLAESLDAIHSNQAGREVFAWVAKCLTRITAAGPPHLTLAFCQRLCDRCDPSTQRIRTDLVDLVQMCISSADSEISSQLQTFCASNLVLADKATKRALGIEVLAALVASTSLSEPIGSVVFQALAHGSCDPVPSVRCSALRSLSQLSAASPFTLLQENEILLKHAIRAARMDDKAGVRRWAIKVLATCPEMHSGAFEACVERCRDLALSVRKVAVEAVGEFMARYPKSTESALCSAVLPLMKDEEKSVMEACLAIVCRSLLSPTQDLHQAVLPLLYNVRSESDADNLGWALREISMRTEYAPMFKDFLGAIGNEALVSLPTEAEARRVSLWSTWLVLSKTAQFDRLPSPKMLSGDFLMTAWSRVSRLVTLSEDDDAGRLGEMEAHALQRRVLEVCRTALDRIANRAELGNDILRDLAELDRPPQVCSAMLALVEAMSGPEQQGEQLVRGWGMALKNACEAWLGTIVVASGEPAETAAGSFSKTDGALFLLGELALIGFQLDEKRIDRIVPFSEGENDSAIALVQAMASPEVSKSTTTRALALMTLGKLCLRDEVLAKRCAPIFVRELALGDHFSVRVNCLVVLGDLCRRYTNVVEPFIERISRSFGDANPIVRKRSVLILGGLMQEEYVKMRPFIFFRLLACIGDDSEDIVQAATFVLLKGLLTRNPTLFQSNAAAMIFALNGLPRYLARSGETEGDDAPCIVGLQNDIMRSGYEKRSRIYKLVFSRLEDATKLEITNKLRRDVFGGLLEGTISLDKFDLNVSSEREQSEVTACVMDTLRILESDFARPSVVMSAKGSQMLTEDGEESTENTAVNKATAKIIDTLERRNVGDNVVPLLASLYMSGSKARSSIVKPILDHIKFLYERFRTECVSGLAPYREIHSMIQMELGFNKNRRALKPLNIVKVNSLSNTVVEPTAMEENEGDKTKTPMKKLSSKTEAESFVLTKDKTPRLSRRAKAALMMQN